MSKVSRQVLPKMHVATWEHDFLLGCKSLSHVKHKTYQSKELNDTIRSPTAGLVTAVQQYNYRVNPSVIT